MTASENVNGPLLVIEIQRGDEQSVRTAAYVSQPIPRMTRPAIIATPLWQQQEPILDAALNADRMVVLSPGRIQHLQRRNGKWEPVEYATFDTLSPARDQRGKLLVTDEGIRVFLSGGTCRGGFDPSLQVRCDNTSGEFPIDDEQVHFIPGENFLETTVGDKLFSLARSGDFKLLAASDGLVHASRGPVNFSISGWGSDIIALAPSCTAAPVILADSPSNTADSITAYELTGPNPRRLSEPWMVQGSITALWPASGGALAVVHEAALGRYAAYLVSLDCGN